MPRVRETDPSGRHDLPKAAPRGRCRNCGKRFTRKRAAQVFCTPNCRKRAADASTPPKTASDLREKATGGGHLGTSTTEFRSPLRPAETSAGVRGEPERGEPLSEETKAKVGAARRARRYQARRTLWRVTTDKACRGCGRTVMDPDTGVVLAQTTEGVAVTLGLLTCGRIWLCPVCSAKIRHGRAQEITSAVVAWLQQGGTAYLVTFTARHAAAHRLADLMDAIQGTRADAEAGIRRRPGAYQRLITGAAWAGDKRRAANPEGIRGRVGYIGMIRATEITVGVANGWHPHIHAIVFVGGRTTGERGDKRVTGTFTPSTESVAELEQHFRGVWTRHLAKVDPDFKPSQKHGVDFKPLKTERDAKNMGEYIAKLQEGSRTINPANEVARGDLKEGRYGNQTPFQILNRIGDLLGGMTEEDAEGHGSLEWCLRIWAEYEVATAGRRAIEWTRYLRPLLGLAGGDTEDDDLDMLFELDGATGEFRAGVHVEERTWGKLTGRALDLAVLEAVEGDDVDMPTITDLAVAAGSRSGAVRLLSSTEVAEAWEAILTTLAVRREAAAERRRRAAEESPDTTQD